MQNFDLTREQYLKLKPYPVDRQLLVISKPDLLSEMPLSILLQQFKYCMIHNVRDAAYVNLRAALVNITSEKIVTELEELKQ